MKQTEYEAENEREAIKAILRERDRHLVRHVIAETLDRLGLLGDKEALTNEEIEEICQGFWEKE